MELYQDSNYVTNYSSDIELFNLLLNDLPDVRCELETTNQSLIHYQSPIQICPTSSFSTPIAEYIKEEDKSSIDTLTQQDITTQRKILCPICNDGDAGCHKHYGGKACISCRAFFRRSVRNEAYKSFKCNNLQSAFNGKCEINSTSWTSCRYCRFQQCLVSGLKILLVLNKGQRSIRQIKSNTKLKKSSNNIFPKSQLPTISTHALSNASFTNEEVMIISFRVDQFMFDFLSKKLAKFYVENPEWLYTRLMLSSEKNRKASMVDIANKQSHSSWWQTMFKQFLLETYDDCKKVDPIILETLSNYNLTSVYFINSAITVGNGIVPSPSKELLNSVFERKKYLSQFLPCTTSDQDEQIMQNYECNAQDQFDYAITVIATRLLRYNIEVKPVVKALDYNQVYPPEMWTGEAKKWEKDLRSNIHDVARWATKDTVPKDNKINQDYIPREKNTRLSSSDIKVDYVLLHLLSLITFYSTDSCMGIKDTSSIERLQCRYLNLLHKYLTFQCPHDAHNLLARGMTLISKARESCSILQIFISWLSP